MPVIMPVNYSAIRSQLQTGDLLAFEGSQPLDIMINLLEEGGYSHVGMVLRDEEDNLWFWDAPGGGQTFTDPYWKETGPNTGCRVANLDCLLAYYMSNMGLSSFTWRKLSHSVPYSPGSALDTFIAQTDGTPFPGDHCNLPLALLLLLAKYDQGKDLTGVTLGIGLLLAYLTGSVLLVPTSGYVFCAQLVAMTYMTVGLLPTTPLPPNGYTPAMFLDQPQQLVLLNSASLSVPTPVIWDGTCPSELLGTAPQVVRTPPTDVRSLFSPPLLP